MRVIVCGSRNWLDEGYIWERLDDLVLEHGRDDLTIIQGEGKGADTIAKEWAQKTGVACEGYPAEWGKYGNGAGPIRNMQMLKTGADMVIAFKLVGSTGTNDMIRQTNEEKIPLEVHTCSFSVTCYNQ